MSRALIAAIARPTVSTPVTWDEVERAHNKKDAGLLVFEAKEAVARFEKLGDLFEPVLGLKQTLPNLKKLAAAAVAEKPEPVEIAAQAGTQPLRRESAPIRDSAAVRIRFAAQFGNHHLARPDRIIHADGALQLQLAVAEQAIGRATGQQ